jgi:putative ABC transport system substrate-binding protein
MLASALNRRAALAGALSLPFHRVALAQRARPMLAILALGFETGPRGEMQASPLRTALAELGWIDGQTIDIAARFADGVADRLPALAAELVALQPDVVFTHSSAGVRAVEKVTKTIPVVVGPAGEEELLRAAGNFARPRGNITGFTFSSIEEHSKLLDILKQAHPKVARVGLLVDPQFPSLKDYPRILTPAASALGLTLVRIEARRPALSEAFDRIKAAPIDALIVLIMPGFNDSETAREISALALRQGIAVVGSGAFYAQGGALLSYGTDYVTLVRRAATYIDRILKGTKPAELPVERPSVFRLIVNLRTANALGLSIPPALLARADEVIE